MSNRNGTPNTLGCFLMVLLTFVCLKDLDENPMLNQGWERGEVALVGGGDQDRD